MTSLRNATRARYDVSAYQARRGGFFSAVHGRDSEAFMITTGNDCHALGAFLAHAHARPDAIAVETRETQVSYGLLNERADALRAHFERNGLTARSVIPLLLPRGVDLVVAELAALKLGACFLPIDPGQPRSRMAEILGQSGASHVITTRKLPALEPLIAALPEVERRPPGSSLDGGRSGLRSTGFQAVFVEASEGRTAERNEAAVIPDDLAYVIFTSGSTGVPKGVMISRRSLDHFCRYWIAKLGLGPGEKMTFLASPGFDTSIDEIWPTLASGATLSIPDDDSRFAPALLQQWINDRGVTVCDAPTAVAEILLDLAWPKTSLKVLVAGGDRLTRYPPAHLPFRFLNAYGPTEHTIVSAVEEVLPAAGTAYPAIGHPISETEIHIVDANFDPVPEGEIGEIVISGTGLARGYLGASAQTADRFVPNPFSGIPGARCYRTGDAGSKDAGGRIHFHGRTDSQLSIRGNRVEPEEIARAIRKNPHVADAFVTALNDPDRKRGPAVVAYYVPKDRTYTPSKKELTEFLQDLLVSYMIPDHFVVVAELPLNLSGKVDPKLLPKPSALEKRPRDVKKPTDRTQAAILSLWQQALGLDPASPADAIGVDENFFDLGGHSLAAIRITAALTEHFQKPISLKQFYESPTIEALASSLPRWSAIPAPPILRTQDRASYPLSFQQDQVFFFQNLAPSSNAYNSQSTIRIRGPLDLDALSQAINALTARHELLRTTYTSIHHEAVQVVHERFDQELPCFDLTNHPDPVEEREQLIRRLLGTVFDLSRLPLAKWSLIRLGAEEHDLVLVEHHIVHDGWTLSVVFRELQEYYNAAIAKRDPQLPELPVQYRDFAVWQKENIAGEYFQSQLEYWKSELAGAPQVTALPYDFPRPRKQTFRGDLLSLDLPERLSTQMKVFAKAHRFTFFEVMFSVFSLLLHQLSQEDDICVGTALANRERPETAGLIGMFVNVVVIRSIVQDGESFARYVRRIKDKIVGGNMNQAYPFAKLIQKLNVARDSAVNPLFQAMFSFHDSDVVDPVLGEANCFIDHLHGNSSAKQDLDVVVIPRNRRNRGGDSESDERISMIWEFNRDLFARETIQRFIDRYLYALERCLSDPEVETANLAILPPKEVARLAELSAPVPSHSIDIGARIREQFQSIPDKICVIEPDREYSYRDLAHQIESLKAAIGPIEPEEPVGILLPRGFLQIAGQQAIWEAGGAFVPMDPSTPAGRVRTIVEGAAIRTVLTTADRRGLLPPSVRAVCVEPTTAPPQWTYSPLDTARTGRELAYLIFTSGSTGVPKGVAVQVDSLFGYCSRNIADFHLTARSRVLVYNSPGFDSSLGDSWPALAVGATLCVPSEETRYSAPALIDYLNRQQVTFADVPTAMAEQMLNAEWPEECVLETLLVGGERLKSWPSPSHRFRLHNEYGPTEATVSATSGRVPPRAVSELLPDIGRPIAGRGCVILDEKLRFVPIGVKGDLYVFGEGLARGYYRDAALTAERFIPHPYGLPGQRMYSTGDIAKWTEEGTLQFVGRDDRQVKIHGFRIELDEISAHLGEFSGITGAWSLIRRLNSGKQEIVSFYVSEDALELSSIREHLNRHLPAYMLPGKLVRVSELPQTLSGKVDEETLLRLVPADERAPSSPGSGPAAPAMDPAQEKVVRIWQTLLGSRSVGVDQNFFELGGHSLLLAELQRAIETDFGVKLPLFDFFEFTTVAALATHIVALSAGADASAQPAAAGSSPLKENLLRRRRTVATGRS